nr:MAG TPA: hypothetical protein [Caudoviricetes sp.]
MRPRGVLEKVFIEKHRTTRPLLSRENAKNSEGG